MLKNVLQAIAWLAACALMFVPVTLVFMLGWFVFVDASWVSKGFGATFMIVGFMMIFPPAKVTYFIIREVWDSNFKWEFDIPLGG